MCVLFYSSFICLYVYAYDLKPKLWLQTQNQKGGKKQKPMVHCASALNKQDELKN